MSDGILNQQNGLRDVRDRIANRDLPGIITGSATLDRASAGRRISGQAGRAAQAYGDGVAAIQELETPCTGPACPTRTVGGSRYPRLGSRRGADPEDGLLALDEENTLYEYLDHLLLTTQEGNANGAHTNLIQAAIIRDITRGIIPQPQNIQGRIPFNLMKSEQLVWVIQSVYYLETVTRRERRGAPPTASASGSPRDSATAPASSQSCLESKG